MVYKPDLSLVEYLSTASERIEWSSNALPDDELCVENAIILHRFNRYPLIIDPSGQAVEYLLKQNQHRRIHTTSFLDLNFMKHLESALRLQRVEAVATCNKLESEIIGKYHHQ